jgi:hypothetical protein
LREWAEYSSDGVSQVKINYPKDYLEFPFKVSDYKISHNNRFNHPDHLKFTTDIISAVDSKIDFSGTNFILVVVPPGTPLNIFEQGFLKDFRTQEGLIRNGSTQYPLTFNGLETVQFSNFLSPSQWILWGHKEASKH